MAKRLRLEEASRMRLGEREIAYHLKRSSGRRSISLRVDEGGLTVNVPWRTSERRLRDALNDAEVWVLKKIEVYTRPQRPHWLEQRMLKFLGEDLAVKLLAGNGRVLREGGVLTLVLTDPADRAAAETLAEKWLRQQATMLFRERTAHYATLLGASPAKVALSNARGRWGSCNARHHVRLSWRLIQAPLPVIDYVVAHELAHLIELNHSPAFWQHVKRIYPDFESARLALNSSARDGMPL